MMKLVPEATAELGWRKSSYSAGNGGECVEVARAPQAMFVRDSKIADGPHLTVTHTGWSALLRGCSHA